MNSRDSRRRRAQIVVLVVVAAMVLGTLLGVISSLQAQATDAAPNGERITR